VDGREPEHLPLHVHRVCEPPAAACGNQSALHRQYILATWHALLWSACGRHWALRCIRTGRPECRARCMRECCNLRGSSFALSARSCCTAENDVATWCVMRPALRGLDFESTALTAQLRGEPLVVGHSHPLQAARAADRVGLCCQRRPAHHGMRSMAYRSHAIHSRPVRDLLTALWPLKVELCLLVLVLALVFHSIITPCAPAGRLRR
jgi:hypothetical protein